MEKAKEEVKIGDVFVPSCEETTHFYVILACTNRGTIVHESLENKSAVKILSKDYEMLQVWSRNYVKM